MVTATLNKRLLRMIASTKGQFIAAVLVITCGIFTYTALTNAGINLDQTLSDYYEDTHFADAFLTTAYIAESQASRLAHDSAVLAAQSRIITDVPLITDDEDERVTVRLISAQPEQDTLNQLYLKSGQLSIKGNEVLIIDQFAQGRQIALDDTIDLQINGRSQPFTVAGIVSSSEFVYLMQNAQTLMPDPASFGVVYVDLAYLQQISGHTGMINNILLSLRDPEQAQAYLDALKDDSGLPIVSAVARKDQLSNSMMRQEIDSLQKMSSSVPIIFLLFAAVMLVTTLSRTVKGDRMTIGVLKALGYSNHEIVTHYTLYALLVGLSGGILGNIIGLTAAGGMTNLYLLYFNMPAYANKLYISQVFFSIVGTCLLAIAAGVYGSRSILKITPADAMRPEPPKQGRHIWLDHHLPVFWRNLSFSSKLILRSLAREKKKALLVSAGVAMTCGMLLTTFWFNDVFDSMTRRYFDETMTMDYTLSTESFIDASAARELTHLPAVEIVESRLELPSDLTYGPYTKSVAVLGLDPDTAFVQLKDASGRLLPLDHSGMIISSNLAQSLHIQPGDTLMVKNLLMNDREAAITVTAINEQLLGIGAYMSLEALSTALADQNVVNGFYLKSDADLNSYFRDMSAISAVSSKTEMRTMYDSFTGLMVAAVIFLIFFSGLLGGAIIYSTTIMSIHERTAEFSSLRVLGYRQQEIFRLLVGENLLLSAAGLLLGLPLGRLLIWLMEVNFTTDLYTLTEPISATTIFLTLICSIAFVLAAQLITYRRIKRMDFIQALKTRIS